VHLEAQRRSIHELLDETLRELCSRRLNTILLGALLGRYFVDVVRLEPALEELGRFRLRVELAIGFDSACFVKLSEFKGSESISHDVALDPTFVGSDRLLDALLHLLVVFSPQFLLVDLPGETSRGTPKFCLFDVLDLMLVAKLSEKSRVGAQATRV